MGKQEVFDWKKELMQLPKEKLVDFIEMCNKNLWTLQNNWIVNIEREYGHHVAVKFDGIVFPRLMEVTVYRLRKLFNLGDDIQALHEVFKFAVFSTYGQMVFPEITEKKLVRRVVRCPMQLDRRKGGLPELACKPALEATYSRVAKAINPKMKLTRVWAPPDPHPVELWCEVEFELED